MPDSGSRPTRKRATICAGPTATSSAGVGMSLYSPSSAKYAPTASQSRLYSVFQNSSTNARSTTTGNLSERLSRRELDGHLFEAGDEVGLAAGERRRVGREFDVGQAGHQ